MSSAAGFTRTGRASGVKDAVIRQLAAGATPRLAAQRLGLPVDLVDLIVERERAAGRLDVLAPSTGRCGGPCDPDPQSLVCAGCPILPIALRRRQSLTGKLRRGIQRELFHTGG